MDQLPIDVNQWDQLHRSKVSSCILELQSSQVVTTMLLKALVVVQFPSFSMMLLLALRLALVLRLKVIAACDRTLSVYLIRMMVFGAAVLVGDGTSIPGIESAVSVCRAMELRIMLVFRQKRPLEMTL